MASNVRSWKSTMRVLSLGRHRATRRFTAAAIVAASLLGTTLPAGAATTPALGIVIVGSGRVTSQPAGIACPGRCTATFAAGTSVVLTAQPNNGSTFLQWGGSCTGTGACTVKMSTLRAVAAQFLAEAKTQPLPTPYVAVPGPYSGSNGQNGTGITFYVTPGGSSILNVFVPTASIACSPSGSGGGPFGILQAAIQPDGSFSATASHESIGFGPASGFSFLGDRIKVTSTVTGHFHAATATTAASAAGVWRYDIDVAHGTTPYLCTSNDQSWTATLSREPLQHKIVVEPGNYSGSNGQTGSGVTFSVAPGGRSMLNISVPTTDLPCTPAKVATDHLAIPQVPIEANGSFASTTSQQGVFNGEAAKFTYTFVGHFEAEPHLVEHRPLPGYGAKTLRPPVARPQCARPTTRTGRRVFNPRRPAVCGKLGTRLEV